MSVCTASRFTVDSVCQVRNWAGSHWGLLPGATRLDLSLEGHPSDRLSIVECQASRSSAESAACAQASP